MRTILSILQRSLRFSSLSRIAPSAPADMVRWSSLTYSEAESAEEALLPSSLSSGASSPLGGRSGERRSGASKRPGPLPRSAVFSLTLVVVSMFLGALLERSSVFAGWGEKDVPLEEGRGPDEWGGIGLCQGGGKTVCDDYG
jgi:hypothetical protein